MRRIALAMALGAAALAIGCGGRPPSVGTATEDFQIVCSAAEKFHPDTLYTTPAFDPPGPVYYGDAEYSYGAIVPTNGTINMHNQCTLGADGKRLFQATITPNTGYGYSCSIGVEELQFPNTGEPGPCTGQPGNGSILSPPFSSQSHCLGFGTTGNSNFGLVVYQMRSPPSGTCTELQTGKVYSANGVSNIANFTFVAGDATRPAGDIFYSLDLVDYTATPNTVIYQFGIAQGGSSGVLPL